MSNDTEMSEEEIRIKIQEYQDELRKRKKLKTNRKDHAVKLANELSSVTETVFEAQKAYAEKGFEVIIETSSETGLITKWKLKNKYPQRVRAGGGGVNNVAAVKTMSVQEFNSIVNRLGDGELSSKDIMNALIGSGIGARKLQPTLGLILRGMHGEAAIKKVAGTDKGPGVRYIKVN